MRRLYTAAELRQLGLSRDAIRSGTRTGLWRRVDYGIYGEGSEEPSRFDRARAVLLATDGIASGTMAGALLRLDGVEFECIDFTVVRSSGSKRTGARHRQLAPERVIEVSGVRCTDGIQTLVDLAAELDDHDWEAALESALRLRLVRMEDLERAAQSARRGVRRIRRVLAVRPPDAPPTESFLETKMVQLARTVPLLPPPARRRPL